MKYYFLFYWLSWDGHLHTTMKRTIGTQKTTSLVSFALLLSPTAAPFCALALEMESSSTYSCSIPVL
jgi:hypothetical protein